MTLKTGSGINPSFYSMTAQIVTAMGQVSFGRAFVFITGLDLLFIGMAIGTKGFLMAYRACLPLLTCVKLMFQVKILGFVVQSPPLVAMALRTVDRTA